MAAGGNAGPKGAIEAVEEGSFKVRDCAAIPGPRWCGQRHWRLITAAARPRLLPL